MNNDEDDFFDEDESLVSLPVVMTWIAIPVLLWVGMRVSDYVRTTMSGISTFDEERR